MPVVRLYSNASALYSTTWHLFACTELFEESRNAADVSPSNIICGICTIWEDSQIDQHVCTDVWIILIELQIQFPVLANYIVFLILQCKQMVNT